MAENIDLTDIKARSCISYNIIFNISIFLYISRSDRKNSFGCLGRWQGKLRYFDNTGFECHTSTAGPRVTNV